MFNEEILLYETPIREILQILMSKEQFPFHEE